MTTPRTSTQTKHAKALLVQSLWARGREAARRDDVDRMAGLVLCDLAVETCLKAFVLDKGGAHMEALLAAATTAWPGQLPDAAPVLLLHRHRNRVQHEGEAIARGAAERLLNDAEPYLAAVFRLAVGVELGALTYAGLLSDPLLRFGLDLARDRLARGDASGAAFMVAACFQQMHFRVAAHMTEVDAGDPVMLQYGPATLHALPTLAFRDAPTDFRTLVLDVRLKAADGVDLAALNHLRLSPPHLIALQRLLAVCEKAAGHVLWGGRRTQAVFRANGARVAPLLDALCERAWWLEQEAPSMFGADAVPCLVTDELPVAWLDDASGDTDSAP